MVNISQAREKKLKIAWDINALWAHKFCLKQKQILDFTQVSLMFLIVIQTGGDFHRSKPPLLLIILWYDELNELGRLS